MSRLTAIFPLVLLLVACNTGNNTTKKTPIADTAMSEPAVNSYDRGFQGAWFEVTPKDSDYIIYQPCGLDLRIVRVIGDSLFYQEQMEFNSAKLKEPQKSDSQTVIHSERGAIYTFKWKDRDKGLAYWKVKYSDASPEVEHLFVDSLTAYQFKKVNEPGCK